MKKSVLSLIAGAGLLIAPMTASALSPMSADNMKEATGQAGVSIAVDNILLYQSVGATTYTDTDGYYDMDAKNGMGGEAEGASASIVIGDKEKVTTIFAILDGTDRGGKLKHSYGSDFVLQNGDTLGTVVGIDQGDIRPLNIDVASRTQILSAGMMYNASGLNVGAGAVGVAQDDTVDAATAITANTKTDYVNATVAQAHADSGDTGDLADWSGLAAATATAEGTYDSMADVMTAYNGTQVAGVVIGLPTVEICTTADSYDIGLSASGAHNDGKKFIHISKGESVLAILGGTIEIAAH